MKKRHHEGRAKLAHQNLEIWCSEKGPLAFWLAAPK